MHALNSNTISRFVAIASKAMVLSRTQRIVYALNYKKQQNQKKKTNKKYMRIKDNIHLPLCLNEKGNKQHCLL